MVSIYQTIDVHKLKNNDKHMGLSEAFPQTNSFVRLKDIITSTVCHKDQWPSFGISRSFKSIPLLMLVTFRILKYFLRETTFLK